MHGVVAFLQDRLQATELKWQRKSNISLASPLPLHHVPLSHSDTVTAWLTDPWLPSHSSWGKEEGERCLLPSWKHTQGHSDAPAAEEKCSRKQLVVWAGREPFRVFPGTSEFVQWEDEGFWPWSIHMHVAVAEVSFKCKKTPKRYVLCRQLWEGRWMWLLQSLLWGS